MIPVNEPLLAEQEINYVMECLRTGWISSEGNFVREFEEKWADYCGKRFGIAVSSGTAALEIAVRCLDLKPGDEVIMPTFTIISCAQAVTRVGAIPVLVDSDQRTWCMDVNQIEAKITPRTKALMPVHIYGHPVDMDPLRALAGRYNLTIVEDAAEAHGAEYQGKKCGGIGDISCFSFYANKIITTGEGGMVLTDDEQWAHRARALRNLCFNADRRFFHTELGFNYRLTNIQAAIGVAQIERIAELVARKRAIGQAYTQRLQGKPGLRLPVEEPWAKNVYWMYGVVLEPESGLDAAKFSQRLADCNVITRPFFLGMHEQPVFQDMRLFAGERYPVAEDLARQGLYLPSGLALTADQIEAVCVAVNESLQ